MSLRFLRMAIAIAVVTSPACVVKLTDKNSPLVNGGVTGAAANCAAITPTPHAAVGTGPAEALDRLEPFVGGAGLGEHLHVGAVIDQQSRARANDRQRIDEDDPQATAGGRAG